jgi:hypothetical protein
MIFSVSVRVASAEHASYKMEQNVGIEKKIIRPTLKPEILPKTNRGTEKLASNQGSRQ